jgi:hypothetical protein
MKPTGTVEPVETRFGKERPNVPGEGTFGRREARGVKLP